MIERLSARHVVLLGIGHTNAHVLRMWRMNPIPDTDLTCISDFGIATYSGMMPAVLAGQVQREGMEIDLVRLCASVGARLITDPVVGIDHANRMLQFDDRPAIPFDVLSIGIGSTATREGLAVEGQSLVEVKPMQTFLDRLDAAIDRSATSTLRVSVVGGGVAGVEICMCLPGFLERKFDRPFTITLLTSGETILPSTNFFARRSVQKELHIRGIQVLTESRVQQVSESVVVLENGSTVDSELVIWATGATAPPLLDHLGLDLDDRGFIETDSTLQTKSAKHVFAVGDTGTIVDQNLPKAGVYAVRQGPILWKNIHQALAGNPLQPYRPQRTFLKLINLGDGRAVGAWRGLALTGHSMMRWKDRIDRSFMEKFQVRVMETGDDPMQCRGCGCKLETDSLQTGLASIGVDSAEDAVQIGCGDTRLLASTDFFASPVDDSYLAGRIAAIHSASDIFASGAVPTEALANIVVAEGAKRAQQQVLSDVMLGAKREFESMGAKIVGGHTIVGPRMETGFTVIGRAIGAQPIRKGNLKVGDRLFLTKPLGIGVLLAAQMRGQCRAAWYESLIDSMLAPQMDYAQITDEVGITAGTDVTGFGLAGHLIEMLAASGLSADLDLDRVPVLPGVIELIQNGIESSLAPENRRAEKHIGGEASDGTSKRYQVLFDPQTCGGMLFGVAQERAVRFRQAAKTVKLPMPVEIGRVIKRDGDVLINIGGSKNAG